MYTIIAQEEDLIAVKFTGKVHSEDYDALIPIVREKIKKYGKINVYWEMEQFKGWDVGGFYKEIKFDISNATKFNKVAIVGDKKWQEGMANFMKPFTSAKIHYFDIAKREEAMEWIGLTHTLIH